MSKGWLTTSFADGPVNIAFGTVPLTFGLVERIDRYGRQDRTPHHRLHMWQTVYKIGPFIIGKEKQKDEFAPKDQPFPKYNENNVDGGVGYGKGEYAEGSHVK